MTAHRDQLIRLYDCVFDRAPDATGLPFWEGHMANGWTLPTVAGLFIQAEEFKLTYGQPDNGSFVRSLYSNVLDRPGEAGGVSFWTSLLDQGRAGRADIVVGFSESQEHKDQMAAVQAAPQSSPGVTKDPNGYPTITGTEGADTIYGTTDAGYDPGINYKFRPGDDPIKGLGGNDVIHGLSGNDYLEGGDGGDTIFGGAGADYLMGDKGYDRLEGGAGDDVFYFRAGDGIDFITDFQRGDRIQLADTSLGWHLSGPQGEAQGSTLSYGKSAADGYTDSVFLAGITEADHAWVREAVFT